MPYFIKPFSSFKDYLDNSLSIRKLWSRAFRDPAYLLLCIIVVALLFLALTSCNSTEILAPISSPTIIVDEETATPLPPIVNIDMPVPSETPTPTATVVPEPEMERLIVVLLGGDWENARPERVRFGIRTDVFLLVIIDHWDDIDYSRMSITVVSIPRDLFIRVPCSETYNDVDPADDEIGFEFGKDRINAAWWYGGFACVSDTIGLNFDYKPDFHAFVDFDGFMEIVNIFDGLYLTPNKTYRDWCGNLHGTDGDDGKWVTWYKDTNYYMRADELLCYVRARKGATDGDLDRNRRHLEVIQAMAVQYPQIILSNPLSSLDEAVAFLKLMNNKVDTDIGILDIPKYVGWIDDFNEAIWWTIRFDFDVVEYYTTSRGASVLKPLVFNYGWLTCVVETGMREICTERYLFVE